MPTLPEQVVELLGRSPGLSDREITNSLRSLSDPQQHQHDYAELIKRILKVNAFGLHFSSVIGACRLSHDVDPSLSLMQ